MGLFVNVHQALYILKKYYNDFASVTETQFDLKTILDSIDDKNSSFWKKVFENHYLHGLLLGFGEKNSFLFDHTSKSDLVKIKAISFQRFKELSRSEKHSKGMMQPVVSIKNLVIPYFVTFNINDEIIDKYQKEKESIVQFLEEKNFTDFVLQCLNGTIDSN
ncbi:MAG: hypothetical protein S4CHLAM45_13800 [Chlamydiales bacterium]|nr:hypothetical protein [Chlamydiales bacterium]MCH9620485.1 hypothetical protein [Chlamydiales bacterium]MCH9623470.1 hypothetical protein [Chlamydiales bacterium]